jgi:kinesin family protein 1
MLEIYNEQVRDLLAKEKTKGGLVVRQHPSKGSFYAEDLKKIPIGSYAEILTKLEEGTTNRTVASTNMNFTSSRAHTIATLTFDQIFNTDLGMTKKSSIINLIDLAGSERVDSTSVNSDRLKEGVNINKSLSTLGNCISV